MDMITYLSAERIAHQTDVSSTKRAFEALAALLHQGTEHTDISLTDIFDALIAREKLGSTTLGNGIAVPHASVTIDKPVSALLVLDEGLDMDTPDKQPVWFFLALLVPHGESQHYGETLSQCARILSQHTAHDELAQLNDAQLTLNYLHSIFNQDLAA